jgi:serine/threonine protein kinase
MCHVLTSMSKFRKSPSHAPQVGVPGFIAPEILLRQPYGEKVDVFAAGVVLHILLVGYAPFSTKFMAEGTRKVLRRNLECRSASSPITVAEPQGSCVYILLITYHFGLLYCLCAT